MVSFCGWEGLQTGIFVGSSMMKATRSASAQSPRTGQCTSQLERQMGPRGTSQALESSAPGVRTRKQKEGRGGEGETKQKGQDHRNRQKPVNTHLASPQCAEPVDSPLPICSHRKMSGSLNFGDDRVNRRREASVNARERHVDKPPPASKKDRPRPVSHYLADPVDQIL